MSTGSLQTSNITLFAFLMPEFEATVVQYVMRFALYWAPIKLVLDGLPQITKYIPTDRQ